MQILLEKLVRHRSGIVAILLFLAGFASIPNVAAQTAVQTLQDFRTTFPQLSESQLINRIGAGDPLAELELAVRLSEGRGSFAKNSSAALRWYNRAARQGANAREFAGSLPVTVDQLPLPVIRNVGVDGARGGVQSNLAPQAVINASVLSGAAPLTVAFDASSSTDDSGIILYSWVLGDGTSSNQVQTGTTYQEPGNYPVTLVVMDAAGRIDRTSGVITVLPPLDSPPVASFDASLTSVNENSLALTFVSTASDDLGIELFSWDLGDGTVADTATVDHIYTVGGTYDVALTVTDTAGQTVTASEQIIVEDPEPTAVISASATDGEAPLVVALDGSSSIDNTDIESYTWDLGDGGEAITTASTSVTYVTAGTYTINLTVTDIAGQESTATQLITVTEPDIEPIAVIVASETDGEAPLTVTVDGGTSTDDTGVESYSWDLGDGSDAVTTASTSVTYTTAGTYTISLTVTDIAEQESTATQVITVTAPDIEPTAVIVASEIEGGAPLAVTFDGSTSTDDVGIESYSWDLGDDSDVVTTESASVTYTTAGSYTVSLTVTDIVGQTSTAMQLITVTEPDIEPTAVIVASETEGDAPLTVTFDGSTSTDDIGIESYSWDLDNDSDVVTTESTSATYTTAGSYTVALTVTDIAGQESITTQTITVTEPLLVDVTAPVPLQPVRGDEVEQDDTNFRFEWQPVADALTYDFEITDSVTGIVTASSGLTNATAFCGAETCRFTFASADFLEIAQSHSWRIRVTTVDGTSDWANSEVQIVPVATQRRPAPIFIAPESGASLVFGSTVDFTWELDPLAVGYDIVFFDHLASGDKFEFIRDLDPDDICDAGVCAYTSEITQTVNGTSHSWEVRALNSQGVSDRTRHFFATVPPSDQPPEPPVAVSPAAGTEVLANSTITFVWSQSSDATIYELDLEDSGDNIFAVITGLDAATYCSAGPCTYDLAVNLDPALDYQWKVRARNVNGASEFTITPIEVVETLSNQPPIAFFEASVLVGTEPLLVEFDASGSSDEQINGIADFHWDFGDAAVQQGPDLVQVMHSFEAGTFNAVLTVTDIEGLSHSISVQIVVEGNQAPEASFVAEGFVADVSGLAPLDVSLDASSSSDDVDVVVYEWNFGDGTASVSTDEPVGISHTYATPGVYTITLTTLDIQAKSDTATINVEVLPTVSDVTAIDAARLLTQASFGPTMEGINYVQSIGLESWVDEQLQRIGPDHLPYVLEHSNGSNRWPRHEIWWNDVVEGEDQLRQRVAFALSQIFVVSDIGRTLANGQYGITHFYDQLRQLAFGNYRELLETVTLSPVMGLYLSMLQNAKADPATNTRADENYAREVLQLFSIGLYELNTDGTSQGNNTFTQDQIEAFARVFTGWNYKDAGVWERKFFSSPDLISSMEPFEAFHDTGSKTLLNGVVSPSGLSARADLELALDNIFNHPNVGPFIGKQLIQRLVTSNPTPAYVQRVASAFNNDGTGVRGNLGAVVRAILLDSEARTGYTGTQFGKLREPVIKMAHLWRAFDVQRGQQSTARGEYNTFSPALENIDTDFGQAVLRSPSVFNFFKPDFAPNGVIRDAGLLSPEFEILTENNLVRGTNRITRQVIRHYATSPNSLDRNPSYLDYADELAIAGDSDALLDRLDLLLTNQMMSTDMRAILKDHIDSLPDDAAGLSQRVRDAISLIIVSPEYTVQR